MIFSDRPDLTSRTRSTSFGLSGWDGIGVGVGSGARAIIAWITDSGTPAARMFAASWVETRATDSAD